MVMTIDVEQLLIWAYRDECVDRPGGGRLGPSRNVTASIYDMGALGTRVSGGGAMATSLPEDALTVAAAVERLDQRVPVMQHAKAGTRPNWKITPPSGVVLVDVDGEPLPQRRQERRKPEYLWSLTRKPMACCVRFAGTTLDEARERWLDWMVWHSGLAALDVALRAPGVRLKRWELAAFNLERMPWLSDASVPRLLASRVFLTRRKNIDTLSAQ